MNTCEHTGSPVWSPLSAKMPNNDPAQRRSPFCVWIKASRSSRSHRLGSLLFSPSRRLCFTSLLPRFSALLFPPPLSPSSASLCPSLQSLTAHPGRPTEQGCSVHILYPVAGCHLKGIADTSRALPSNRHRSSP